MTITDFLLARLAEDEAALRFTTAAGRWEAHRDYLHSERGQIRHAPTGDRLGAMEHPADAEHAVRWQPRRVQAEIQAKRAIIARHTVETARTQEECRRTSCCADGCEITYCGGCGTVLDEQECPDLAALAAIDADHPDYDEDWAPATA